MQRYEFAYNWHDGADDAFPVAVARAAKARGIRVLRVDRGDDDAVRSKVDRRRLGVGLFLNTKADGLNMVSPPMLLCRVLKASGTHVVEDPDDAPIYTNRALLMDHAKKAGIPVPAHTVLANRGDDAPSVPIARVRSQLGPNWVARPARGMGINRIVIRGAKSIASALARSKLRTCPRVLVTSSHKAARLLGHEYRFVVWHLFGTVIPCWTGKTGGLGIVSAREVETALLGRLCELVRTIAGVTGLDWFSSEILITRLGEDPEFVVVEPANALALFGPGPKTVALVPHEVARLAAERVVEVAWRIAHGLPIALGTTLVAGT